MEKKQEIEEVKELTVEKDDSLQITENAAIYIVIKWP